MDERDLERVMEIARELDAAGRTGDAELLALLVGRFSAAFTPTLGFATQIISVIVIIFFAFIAFVFWLSSLHDKPDWGDGSLNPHKDHGPHGEALEVLPPQAGGHSL